MLGIRRMPIQRLGVAGLLVSARTSGSLLATEVEFGTTSPSAAAITRRLRWSTGLLGCEEGSLGGRGSWGKVRVLKVKCFNFGSQLFKGRKRVTLMITVVRVR